jgi:hypothetical protein
VKKAEEEMAVAKVDAMMEEVDAMMEEVEVEVEVINILPLRSPLQ